MNSQDRLRMLREVALRADGFQTSAEALGRKAARALTGDKRAQITGLEGMANSALKVTDVLDYIKLRTARQKEWRKDDWGKDLLRYVQNDLRKERQVICTNLKIDEDGIFGLEVHLMLIREFVRQMSAHYEYACKYPQDDKLGGAAAGAAP